MAPQRLPEWLDGFARPRTLDQDFAEQLRRWLHRLRQSERGRQIQFSLACGPQRLNGVVAVTARQLDQRRQLPLHERDGRTQVAFACRLRARRKTVARPAGQRIVARPCGADADREQIVDVGKVCLVRHQAPPARLDDEARAHGGESAEQRDLSG